MQNERAQILIVDDDTNDVFFTKRALGRTKCDCIVEVAYDGNEAIELLPKLDSLQLVLLDLKLPGIGGIEILRFIKGQDYLKDVPVVVLSSSTMESDIQESYNSGAAGYIHKSHDFNEFTRSLSEVLDTYIESDQLK